MRPQIVRPGDHLAQIAAENGCARDEIRCQPAVPDEAPRPGAEPRPGEFVYVPDRPPNPMGIELARDNHGAATTVLRAVNVRLLDEAGKDAPRGTRYRLTVGATVIEGRVETPGDLGRHTLRGREKIDLQWGERPPTIEYAIPDAWPASERVGWDAQTQLAPSRAKVLKPGSVADMGRESMEPVAPAAQGVEDCADRFKSDGLPLVDPDHPHGYLARSVAALREGHALQNLGAEGAIPARGGWDNWCFEDK